MKQHKHHKLTVFRNALFIILAVAAVTIGGRWLKPVREAAVPAVAAHDRWQTNYGKLPLSFEVNKGQAPKPIEFLARGDGYNLALLPGEAVLRLSKSAPNADANVAKTKTGSAKDLNATLQIKLVGANKQAQGHGVESLVGKANYLIGADQKKWQTDVSTYAKVKYENVYPGVDAIFYGHQRQLEYDFVVAPGADPQVIKLDFAGAKSVRLNDNGELVLATAAGEVLQHRPVIYQDINGVRQAVEGGYKLKGNQATFELGAYDTSHPLVIDPVVSYATFLGENSGKDYIRAITVDAVGNVFLTGATNSATFPITFGIAPFGEPIPTPATFMFVTKLNATGTQVIYSTVISGSKGVKSSPTAQEVVSSMGLGIAVDAQGNACAGGNTTTTNFPTTPGAYRTTFAASKDDQADGFVLRLNAAGNALLASTLVGGSGTDNAAGLAIDPAGNFCFLGFTASLDIPNSDPAIGRKEADLATFVARISADGTRLIHSDVLDAGGKDIPKAITTDAAGNIYITGTTQDGSNTNPPKTRFPRTQGTYQYPMPETPPQLRPGTIPGANTYIAKFGPSGQLIYSSMLGSADPTSIAVDHAGNACIVGRSNFVETVGTYGLPDFMKFDVFPRTDTTLVIGDSPTYGPQKGGEMLLKLNATGTDLLVSHRFGYPSDEAANGVAVDAQDFIHVTGFAGIGFISPDGPVELEDLSQAYPYEVGRNYAYHLKFTPDGKTVVGADFIPSAQGRGIALDPAGNAYILGWAGVGFKTTPGALQTKFPQGSFPEGILPITNFIAKLGNGVNPTATPTPGPSSTPTPTPATAFHNIAGRVTDYSGKPMAGISISLSGTIAGTARTDGGGYYSFRNLRDEGVYRVTPPQRGPMINFKTYYPNPGYQVIDGMDHDLTVNFSYSLTSPWVPPDATPTPTPTPASTPVPTPTPAQDSQIVNPRFDQGNMGWTTNGAVQFVNGLARMLPTTSLSPASVGQWITVTPGATYAVTADVAASSTARSTLGVSFEDSSSGGAQAFNNVQQPKTLRVVFTIPAGVSQARIYVQTNGSISASSWATVDNFALTRIN